MKRVIIESPFAGAVQSNLDRARQQGVIREASKSSPLVQRILGARLNRFMEKRLLIDQGRRQQSVGWSPTVLQWDRGRAGAIRPRVPKRSHKVAGACMIAFERRP